MLKKKLDMKYSLLLFLAFSIFSLPVNAHNTELIKRDIAFWLSGMKNQDCIVKEINLIKLSPKYLELVHRVMSSPLISKIHGVDIDPQLINKFIVIVNQCKKKEQHASRKTIEKLIPNLLNTNNGIMKTCYEDDPEYLSIIGDKISGFVYDRLNLYSNMTGLEIQYKTESTFVKCLGGMEEGRYDILTYAKRKPERSEYMDYYKLNSSKEDGSSVYISKKSSFAKFPDEIQQSVNIGIQ